MLTDIFARVAKAAVGGFTAAVAAVASSVTAGASVEQDILAGLAGFVAGFALVWATPNAAAPVSPGQGAPSAGTFPRGR